MLILLMLELLQTMASKLIKTNFSLFLIFFFRPSLSSFSSFPFVPPDIVCNSTPHPNYCRSVLPHNIFGTIEDYGRASMQQSLSDAKVLLVLLEGHLTRSRESLTGSTVRALQDCLLLIDLTRDYLSNALGAMDQANDLDSGGIEDLETLLSAVVTNQDTCIDGLQASSSWSTIKNDLMTPLSNGLQLHIVSLGLFANGWSYKKNRERFPQASRKYPRLPDSGAKDSCGLLSRTSHGHDQRIYEFFRGRKLPDVIGRNVNVSQMVVVDPSGCGNFTTIEDAVFAAPNNTNICHGYFVIYVVAGVYEEYVTIPKEKINLMMVGDGINRTVITGNRSHVGGWPTLGSATFSVIGENFVAVNMTFRNTAGPVNYQAVAVGNMADKSTFYKCSFEGYQDTLFTHSNRQFYKDCDIYGTIDFICGDAAAIFQNCNIYPRLPLQHQFNVITAQARVSLNQTTGISIQNCTIRAADDLASSNWTITTYLGRPWKQCATTVYMETFMGSLINPAGWHEWTGNRSTSTLYYAEFKNTGPGSNTSARVTWPGYHVINATEAANFTVKSFIKGRDWLPSTGVPFADGLLMNSSAI